MPVFEETKKHAEQEKLLQLMSRIETNPDISQRALASELGITGAHEHLLETMCQEGLGQGEPGVSPEVDLFSYARRLPRKKSHGG
jgi:hypothetical protein